MNTLMHAEMFPYSVSKRSIERVLVLEDDPAWQAIIRGVLRKINGNIEVLFSSNTDEAFKCLKQTPNVDLIIADYHLEGPQTGLDFWDTLSGQGSTIPYVLLSGTRTVDFLRDSKVRQSSLLPRYIEKPASMQEFSRQLLEACFPKAA